MNQQQIEDTYSRRSIRQHVMQDIDTESTVYIACVEAVNMYTADNRYYASKLKRVEHLYMHSNLTTEDIVTELFIAVLPIKEISPIQSVAAQLGNRLGFNHVLDGVKTASELIAVCELSGLYSIYHSSDAENGTGTLGIQSHYSLDQEVQDFIAKTMYLPPMICKPKKWTTNSNGGNLNGSGSVILGAINHHQREQALDTLNTIQNIPWELNSHMLEIDETPSKPLNTADKMDQFNIMKINSKYVYDKMLSLGNKFYFPWKYDKRGRMYSQGYHVNLQSTSYKKAILQFHNKELLN